jgi:pSer/pThr/pTyr-binding forkhead associated (FHA) protein
MIQPQSKRLVPKVGRSTGKQFIKNGISLPDDGEVSTMHGRFDVSDGELWYTDANSTNGTQMHGKALSPRDAVQLKVGDMIVVGQTQLSVQSIKSVE